MKAAHYLDGSVQRPKSLARLARGLVGSALVAFCVAAPPAAKADIITEYNLNVTAEVSSYSQAVHGDFITVTGQFLYDNTLGYIVSDNLMVTGNLQASNLPAAGVALNTAIIGSEDSHDIFVNSSDSNYQLSFQFTDSLALNGQFDAIAQTPGTDGGAARFFDAFDGYQNYHIGYFTVSGGATVPEPASLILLGAPVLGLALIRRRAVGKSLR